MWWGLHEGDGVEDVVNVVAEVENGISYDRLGGGNASRKQRQCSWQRQRRLQLLNCKFLQKVRQEYVDLLLLRRDCFALTQ